LGACSVVPDTLIIIVFEEMSALSVVPDTMVIVFILQQASVVPQFITDKGGKRLQTANQEIELLQQDLEDALQEIFRLQQSINNWKSCKIQDMRQ
jgi:hypothetical protein